MYDFFFLGSEQTAHGWLLCGSENSSWSMSKPYDKSCFVAMQKAPKQEYRIQEVFYF
jgi:hypothetical protein